MNENDMEREREMGRDDVVELIFRGCDSTVHKFTEHNEASELLNKLSSAVR
jgi:hypothetical protein